MAILRALWNWWKPIAHRFANFQARVILSLFYFTFLAPFALGMKLLSDPLRLDVGKTRGWVARATVDAEPLTVARRQF